MKNDGPNAASPTMDVEYSKVLDLQSIFNNINEIKFWE
jgi:hypothetical protein